jgi:hypothetical protein
MPIMDKISIISDQIQEEKLNQDIAKKKVEELPKIQKQYDTVSTSSDISEVLLDNSRAVVLIKRLEEIADKTGNIITINIQDAAPAETKKTGSKSKVTEEVSISDSLPSQNFLKLKIILSGKYVSVVNFIDAVEKFEYYCDIIGIQISKNTENGNIRGASGSGISNPFAEIMKDPKNLGILEDKVDASLDAAFYLKKS